MKQFITYLKDIFNSNYLGINIQKTEINNFLDQLKDLIGDRYSEYTTNQQNRDNGKFHLVVLNVIEYNELSKKIGLSEFTNTVDKVLKFPITDLKLMGLGKSEKSGNTAYYVVVQSDQLNHIREHFDLPEKDFHVTIGFKHKDVHGVRKNEIIKPLNKFIDILRMSWEKEGESFEFIKGVKNFDGDFYKLIEPIQINDTNAIFRIGMEYYQISLVDGSLYIVGRWQDEDDKPILSNTIVTKKLKNQ
jgi:hypothetical protein